MGDKKTGMAAWAAAAEGYALPAWEQLPGIPLYMDQVTMVTGEALALFERDEKQSLLTSSMVNNYVKNGVVEHPVHKKYMREHLVKLMMTSLLKQVLSLPEIQRLIAAQLETRDVRAMYDGFCAMQERAVISALERAAAQAGGDRSDMALRVAAEANVGKMIAEKIMDVHFPAPSREKKREKE